MKWILIVTSLSTAAPYAPPATMQEFDSEEACTEAAIAVMGMNPNALAACNSKGEPTENTRQFRDWREAAEIEFGVEQQK